VGKGSLVEALYELGPLVAFAPALKVVDGGKAISLVAVASAIGQDEVMTEIQCVAGPRDEVIDRDLPSQAVVAIETSAVLEVPEELPERPKKHAVGAEKELAEIG
jgi:hypothetical protein